MEQIVCGSCIAATCCSGNARRARKKEQLQRITNQLYLVVVIGSMLGFWMRRVFACWLPCLLRVFREVSAVLDFPRVFGLGIVYGSLSTACGGGALLHRSLSLLRHNCWLAAIHVPMVSLGSFMEDTLPHNFVWGSCF